MIETQDDALRKALAVVRIAVGLIFFLFAEYKVVGIKVFADGIFHEYVGGFVQQHQAVGFYGHFLEAVVLPHSVLFAFLVAWGEMLIALSLISGLWVRAASAGAVFLLLNLVLGGWMSPGAGAPLWRYFGAELDHIPLVLLFVLFFVGRAGETWGLDGWWTRRT